MTEHHFIINPAAGKTDRTLSIRAAVEAAFRNRPQPWRISVSAAPGDCVRLARRACEGGADVRLYACGGDGTLNEVVCGAAGFQNAAVTHYPCGSGNDFIKIFSAPAAFRDLGRLIDGAEAEFDLIQVGERGEGGCSLNICSVGFDARIAADMNRYKSLPLLSGHGAYVLSAGLNLIKGLHAPYRVELDTGESFDRRQTLVCILNGRWYGGGFNPVPEAEPDDGMLEVLLVRAVSRFTAAAVIGSYKKGRYADYPRLIEHYRCRAVTIHTPRPTTANLDGEIIQWDGALTFRLAEERVRFVYPRGLVWRGIGRAASESRVRA